MTAEATRNRSLPWRPAEVAHFALHGAFMLLLVIFPAGGTAWDRVGVALSALLAGLLARWAIRRWRHGLIRFLYFWYPALFFGTLFLAIPHMRVLFDPMHFDPLFQGWDIAIFGFEPALEWQRAWPERWFGELMCLGYTTFYLHLPILGPMLLWRRGDAMANRYLFVVITSFYIHYIAFMLLPAGGPHFFQLGGVKKDPGYIANEILYAITSRADRGIAAFPSSHVGGAVVSALFAFRARIARPFFFISVVTISPAIVYIQAHYFVDLPAGIISGLVCYLAMSRLYDHLARRLGFPPG